MVCSNTCNNSTVVKYLYPFTAKFDCGQIMSIDTTGGGMVELDRSTSLDCSTAVEFDTKGVILGWPLLGLNFYLKHIVHLP